MSKKAPNKYFAPIIIAGITVGFFVSAYKFVFAKPKIDTTTTFVIAAWTFHDLFL